MSWRLGPLAGLQRLRSQPLLVGRDVVEDHPPELCARRPDVIAVPIVQGALGAPHGVRQLRLRKITGVGIEIGRTDRVGAVVAAAGEDKPAATVARLKKS